MKVIIGAISLFCLMLMAFGVYQYMEIQDLQQELMRQQGLTQSWQEKANAASAAQLALSDQAQACLDREIQRETENGIWLEILEQCRATVLCCVKSGKSGSETHGTGAGWKNTRCQASAKMQNWHKSRSCGGAA